MQFSGLKNEGAVQTFKCYSQYQKINKKSLNVQSQTWENVAR